LRGNKKKQGPIKECRIERIREKKKRKKERKKERKKRGKKG